MLYKRDTLYIDGEWVSPVTENLIEIISPATETVIGTVAAAGLPEVELAAAAAQRAMVGEWKDFDIKQRMEVITRAADQIEELSREISQLLTWEMGAPIGSGNNLHAVLDRMRFGFFEAATQVPFCELRRTREGAALVKQFPVGVVAAITPWNTAFGGVVLKTIPALLAGCPVILKPSPQTAIDPFYLADAFDAAGLPRGMFNVLPGGADVGEALVTHPVVNMVTFTGSSHVGGILAAVAGGKMKKVVLECGGKSAALVLADAPLDSTVATISSTNFLYSGQYCRSLSRVLVPQERYGEFVDAFVTAAEGIIVGDPMDERTIMGPLVNEAQRSKTEKFVKLGLQEGARVVCGGARPGALPTGFYFEPTVFADVTSSMRIAREEIFGPVISIISYDGVEDGIQQVNDSGYGLAGAVFTDDYAAGVEAASRIEAGLIGINTQGAKEFVPCGGLKLSGIGDEHGPEGFREFLQPKSILIPDSLADEYESDGLHSSWVGPEL